MGSPLAVGKKPELVIQKRPDAVPNMMDKKRMIRKFRCVGSSFGRSRSTTIFFFFAMIENVKKTAAKCGEGAKKRGALGVPVEEGGGG